MTTLCKPSTRFVPLYPSSIFLKTIDIATNFGKTPTMRREKQTGFALLEDNNIKVFGGSLLTSNPKLKRPISIKKSSHLVMRSLLAKGSRSLLKFDREIRNIVNRQSKRHGVKVYRMANAGDHLHMMILPRSRRAYQAFIRSISGLIARLVTGVERGPATSEYEFRKDQKARFWEKRPFTRIVQWGRDHKETMAYLLRNKFEALGFIPYKIRNKAQRAKFIERELIAQSTAATARHAIGCSLVLKSWEPD